MKKWFAILTAICCTNAICTNGISGDKHILTTDVFAADAPIVTTATAAPPDVFSEVFIVEKPYKTEYNIGEELMFYGGRARGVTYVKGGEEINTGVQDFSAFTIDDSAFDNTKEGAYPIRVCWNGVSAVYYVYVRGEQPVVTTAPHSETPQNFGEYSSTTTAMSAMATGYCTDHDDLWESEETAEMTYTTSAYAVTEPYISSTTTTTTTIPLWAPPESGTWLRPDADYDFDAYVELSIKKNQFYAGDEFDCYDHGFQLHLILKNTVTGEFDPDMWGGYKNYWLGDESTEYNDCFVVDTSEVDFNTPGNYTIWVECKQDVIGVFPLYTATDSGLPEGEYRLRMVEHRMGVPVEVLEKPTNLLKQKEYTIKSGSSCGFEINNFFDSTFKVEFDDDGQHYVFDEADEWNAQYHFVRPSFLSHQYSIWVYLSFYEVGTHEVKITASDGRTETALVTVEPYVETTTTTDDTWHTWFSIKTLPDKVEYYLGEELDLTGGTAEGCANKGSLELDTFTQPMTFYEVDDSAFDSSKTGTYTIYLTFYGKTVSFEVRVVGTGDVNNDGKITVSDAVLLSRLSVEDVTLDLPNGGAENSDADGNGTVDAMDVVRVLHRVAKFDV